MVVLLRPEGEAYMARPDASGTAAAVGRGEPVGVREQTAYLQRPGTMPAAVSTPGNILSNLVGNITSAAVGFVLAPIMIHGLGDLQYGMWALALALLGS